MIQFNIIKIKFLNIGYQQLKLILILSVGLLWTTQILADNGEQRKGITLESTRLIYPYSAEKGITFLVANDSQTPYLIQSQIGYWSLFSDKIAENKIQLLPPFIVLPPLELLPPGESLNLRIRLTKNSLVTDRESLFALQLNGIPSHEANNKSATQDQVRITLALRNTLKLFYRPEGLPIYDVKTIAESLHFKQEAGELIVTNPTPFYVTFDSLSVGGQSINNQALFQMVPPFEQQIYPLFNGQQGEIRWRLVDDYGSATDELFRALSTSVVQH